MKIPILLATLLVASLGLWACEEETHVYNDREPAVTRTEHVDRHEVDIKRTEQRDIDIDHDDDVELKRTPDVNVDVDTDSDTDIDND